MPDDLRRRATVRGAEQTYVPSGDGFSYVQQGQQAAYERNIARWEDTVPLSEQISAQGLDDRPHNPQQSAAREQVQQAARAHQAAVQHYQGTYTQQSSDVGRAQRGEMSLAQFAAAYPDSDRRFEDQLATSVHLMNSMEAYAASHQVVSLPSFQQSFGAVPVGQAANQYQPGYPQQQTSQSSSATAPAQSYSYGAPSPAGRRGPSQ